MSRRTGSKLLVSAASELRSVLSSSTLDMAAVFRYTSCYSVVILLSLFATAFCVQRRQASGTDLLSYLSSFVIIGIIRPIVTILQEHGIEVYACRGHRAVKLILIDVVLVFKTSGECLLLTLPVILVLARVFVLKVIRTT